MADIQDRFKENQDVVTIDTEKKRCVSVRRADIQE
mgnify:CR=1 FL=1